jgi:hypothetical protein
VNHHDASPATATVVLYLTSGGAGSFPPPRADIVVTPERGMVVTWLNVFSDGSHNYLADQHGIQATPDDALERLVLSFRINLSPKDLLEATEKYSRV